MLAIRWMGAVPRLSDALDMMWRANRRNMPVLREGLDRKAQMWPYVGPAVAAASLILPISNMPGQWMAAGTSEPGAGTAAM
jgi:hypothetical protein